MLGVEVREEDPARDGENERSTADTTETGSVAHPGQKDVLGGAAGDPIDPRVRRPVERLTGIGLGHARLVRDEAADDLNARMDSDAVAVDHRIGMRRDSYAPSTLGGRLLLTHELAHVAQRSRVESGSYGAAENEADRVAASAVLGLPDSGRRVGIGSALHLGSCGREVSDWQPDLDRSAYVEDVVKLHELWSRKSRAAVEETTLEAGERETIDERIEGALTRLRAMGIQLSREELYERIMVTGDMRLAQIRTWLEAPRSPLMAGDPQVLRVRHQYLPTNLPAEAGPTYRWQVRLFSRGRWSYWVPMGMEPWAAQWTRQGHRELDSGFWARYGAAEKMEFRAEVGIDMYVAPPGYYDNHESGVIDIVGGIPEDLSLQASPPQPIADEWFGIKFSSWFPVRERHVVEWWVDGENDRTSAPYSGPMHFETPGTHVIQAKVWGSPGGGRKGAKLADSEELDFEIFSAADIGRQRQVLLQRQGLPGLNDFRSSLDTSISALSPRAAAMGPAQPHFQAQLEAQEGRRDELDRHFPDAGTTSEFPADMATLEQTSTYAGPVPAVLVLHEQGAPIPLTMYLRAWHEGESWHAKLVDLTGKKARTFDGSGSSPAHAYRAAFEEWEWAHEYPRGNTVTYAFGVEGLSLPGFFETSNSRNAALMVADWILTVGGIVVAGVLMLAPDPTLATKAAAYAVLTASVLRGGYAIWDNVAHGAELLDSRNVLEAVGIVAAIVGISGSTLRQAGMVGARVARPAMFRAGSWLVWTSTAGDAGSIVFLSAQAYSELQAISSDPTLDEHARATEMVQIMSRLALQSAMFVVSNKDFLSTEFRLTKLYRESIGSRAGVTLGAEARVDMELTLRDLGEDPTVLRRSSDAELLARFAEATNSTSVAGTRGPGAYRTESPGASSHGSLASLLRKIARPGNALHERMNNSSLSNVTAFTGPPPHITARVTLTNAAGVAVEGRMTIRSVEASAMPRGPHGRGGSETGPATMRVTELGDGTLRGDVHVNRDLHATDAKDAVGHEIDEFAGLLFEGHTGGDIRLQQRAGLMRPTTAGVAPDATIHDRAQARELATAWARTSGPPDVRLQQLRDSGKLAAWGLDQTAHLDRRITFLREQGVPEAFLMQVHAELSHRGIAGPVGATTHLTPDRIRHILYEDGSGSGQLSFLGGAHWEPQARSHSQPMLELVEVSSKAGPADTYRAFAECRWLGDPSPKPSPGDPDYPTALNRSDPGFPGVTYDSAKWAVASGAGGQTMKTTFGNPADFISKIERGFASWLGTNPAGGSNVIWTATVDGVRVMGRAGGNSVTGWELRSGFPDASWL